MSRSAAHAGRIGRIDLTRWTASRTLAVVLLGPCLTIVETWNHGSSPTGGHYDDHEYPDIVLGEDLVTNDGSKEIVVTILHEARHRLQEQTVDNCDAACEGATEAWAQTCEGAVSPLAQP